VLYVSYWAKYSINWYGHISNYSKQTYIGANGQPGQIFSLVSGPGTAPLVPRVCLQATLGTDGIFQPNLVPGALVTRGQWFYVELVLTGNTAGNADGAIDWYLNGVHVGSRTGLKITNARPRAGRYSASTPFTGAPEGRCRQTSGWIWTTST